jgi:DNA polymerase III delta prime subunit
MTCNYIERVIDPLQSRCQVLKVIPPSKQDIAYHVIDILKKENLGMGSDDLRLVINQHYPDIRRVLNELQRYSVSGTIDSGILVSLSDESVKKLMKHLKDKNFKAMRSWVAENLDNDSTTLYRNIYDNASTYVAPSSVPQLILILADYSYKNAFVSDIELNTVACCTELMANIEYV